ncbi:MAG TPA: response regulator, partial [Polyangiaceae bacterium]
NTLRGAGLGVAFARSAQEAVRLAGELRPVAITLDIVMPGADGWAALSQLKSSPATSSIPVVVISVVDEPNRGLLLGAADVLVKPVSRDALLASLDRVGVPGRGVTERNG